MHQIYFYFLRSANHEVSSALASSSEERLLFRERKFEEDRTQRQLDREAAREEKQKDRDERLHSQMLVAGFLSRLIPGSTEMSGFHKSEESQKSDKSDKSRNVEVQFKPEEGSEPFPLILSLTTLPVLLRFQLKNIDSVTKISPPIVT